MQALIDASDTQPALTAEEVVANCAFLLFTGHETTTNLIGNGLLALLRHPDQLRRLCAEPTLIGSAVEELLRYDAPVQAAGRVAAEDMQIGDRCIHAGQYVALRTHYLKGTDRRFGMHRDWPPADPADSAPDRAGAATSRLPRVPGGTGTAPPDLDRRWRLLAGCDVDRAALADPQTMAQLDAYQRLARGRQRAPVNAWMCRHVLTVAQ